MTIALPDSGEWLLTAEVPGQPLPPFVKLTVFFDQQAGLIQGMNQSQCGTLSKLTRISTNKFGAFFQINGTRGMFEGTLGETGVLDLRFLSPAPSRAIACPIYLDRDAGARRRGLPAAKAMIAQFAARDGYPAFPNISRAKVVSSLLSRIEKPERIDQGQTYLCGPAAFIYAFSMHDIAEYAKFVIDLYEVGRARIGALDVAPGSFRFDRMPEMMDSAADWIALGSLRDSENWFWQFHTNELPFINARTTSGNDWLTWESTRGDTPSSDVAKWFRKLGYAEVVDETDDDPRPISSLIEADQKYRNGYKVCLGVCANFIEAKTHAEAAAGGGFDHWIVLASPIEYSNYIRFKFFTWGGFRNIEFNLTQEEFLPSYYGFVAARR
ncbi:MAG TPA: hypothetical protein VKS78_12160 [Roseiarcus sp.]|nr:hypothetical protein [Roseiarcus sp.]